MLPNTASMAPGFSQSVATPKSTVAANATSVHVGGGDTVIRNRSADTRITGWPRVQGGIANSLEACDTKSPILDTPAACYCCTVPAPTSHTGSPTPSSSCSFRARGGECRCSRRGGPEEGRPDRETGRPRGLRLVRSRVRVPERCQASRTRAEHRRRRPRAIKVETPGGDRERTSPDRERPRAAPEAEAPECLCRSVGNRDRHGTDLAPPARPTI